MLSRCQLSQQIKTFDNLKIFSNYKNSHKNAFSIHSSLNISRMQSTYNFMRPQTKVGHCRVGCGARITSQQTLINRLKRDIAKLETQKNQYFTRLQSERFYLQQWTDLAEGRFRAGQPYVITHSKPVMQVRIMQLQEEKKRCRCAALQEQILDTQEELDKLTSAKLDLQRRCKKLEQSLQDAQKQTHEMKSELEQNEIQYKRFTDESNTKIEQLNAEVAQLKELLAVEKPSEETTEKARSQYSPTQNKILYVNPDRLFKLLRWRLRDAPPGSYEKRWEAIKDDYRERFDVFRALHELCKKEPIWHLDFHQGVTLLQHFYGQKLSFKQKIEIEDFKQRLEKSVAKYTQPARDPDELDDIVNEWIKSTNALGIKDNLNDTELVSILKQKGISQDTIQHIMARIAFCSEDLDNLNFKNLRDTYRDFGKVVQVPLRA